MRPDVETFCRSLVPLVEADRFVTLLVQLPPACTRAAETLGRLERLLAAFAGLPGP